MRGEGEEGVVVYADLGCPRCAAEWQRLGERPGRLVFTDALDDERLRENPLVV